MKSTKFLTIVLILMITIFFGSFQNQQDYKVLFEKAKYTMETKADLKEAINLFESLIKTYPNEKEYVAKSLLYQGMCYEKLGNQEAVKKYQKLVSNYPGQKNEVAYAKERLSKLIQMAKEVSTTPSIPKFTKINIPTKLSWHVKLSPDGKDLAVVSDKKLWKLPLSGNLGPGFSGTPVQLNTEGIEVDDEAGLSWSDNGKWIAFNELPFLDKPEKEKLNQSIYVISSKGGKPTKVIENFRAGRIENFRISLSPDGKNLAHSSFTSKEQHVYTTPVAGGSPKQLVDIQAREPAFSPDGKWIAYVEDERFGAGGGNLWIVPATGGEPKLIAKAGYATSPVWSPDNSMIAFVDNDKKNQINLVEVPKEGKEIGNVISIAAPEGTEKVSLLAGWSTDNKIAAVISKKVENAIYSLPVNGGMATEVLHDCWAMQPRWSPDGNRIYYATSEIKGSQRAFQLTLASVPANGGIGKLFAKDNEGKKVWQLGNQGGNRISPDGKTIISAAWEEFIPELNFPLVNIWKITTDGIKSEKITSKNGHYADFSPSWSLDGNKIAFIRAKLKRTTSDFLDTVYITTINSSGGEEKILATISDKWINSLVWSPDGKMLAYLSKEKEAPNTKYMNFINAENGTSMLRWETSGGEVNIELAWAPDSRRIAFNDREGEVIKIMNVEDGNIEDIKTNLGDVKIGHIDWSPDGEKFVFAGSKGGNAEFWFMENFLPLDKLAQNNGNENLLAEKENKNFKIRQVWTDNELYSEGAPSPDGRYISYVHYDTGDLGILEIATGKKHRLTNKGTWNESDEFAEYSRWSPNGKQIVYDWYNEKGFIELRIIGIDGSKPLILYKNEEVTWAQTYGWSPDGKQILACFSKKDGAEQIVLVSVDDGSVRVLKMLEKEWPKNINFSPDGNYIVFDSPGGDISLLSTDGNREIKLIEHPANDFLLGWAPDGENILFASDRTGTLSAWLIAVANGKPMGTPKLVKPDIGQFASLGFTSGGSFYYNFGGEFTRDIFSVKIDPESGEILNQPKKLIESFEGHNLNPDYSRDGKHLAYVRRMRSDILCIRSLETGEEREFSLKLKQIELPRWSPDGKSILIAGKDNNNLLKLYQVDTQTGNLTPFASPEENLRGRHEWSPDGKAIFYGQRSITNNRTQIVHRELESGTEKELFLGSDNNQFYLSCSPDGKWLSFFKRTGKELKIIPLAGGESRVLFKCKQNDHLSTLRWTADGKYILFVIRPLANSLRQPEQNKCSLWRIPLEGGEPENLGLEINCTEHLSTHPDGQHIAFYNITDRIGEVWVMENFLPK
ncbi:LpqB family beta-propeller domain-containing protein [Draconibacterium sp.]|nr:LpqB family beta-propeller domain-containing protein [Draconibacterium sp.]